MTAPLQPGSYYMKEALRLARRGLGWVEPNPMVGAVWVQNGGIVARGYHRRFGGPHAEVNALTQCRESGVDPRGCDLYVTLEPCDHEGKTGPCTEALIEAGVERVFVAMQDPNPAVAGRGIKRLREAGVHVDIGLCQPQAQLLNEPFTKRMTTGLPWVIAKLAQTVDGYIATRGGDSQWISNPRSRRMVHQIRARVDAIMVGIGTALADNPRLTARGVPIRRVARRVILDPDLRIPADARVFESSAGGSGAVPVTLGVKQKWCANRLPKLVELEARGVEFVGLPPSRTDPSRLELKPLLRHLADRHGATNVLVEGGSKLVGALIGEQLIDQALIFVAPKLLGDVGAVPTVQGLAHEAISDAQTLSLCRVKRLDHDVLLDYRFVYE